MASDLASIVPKLPILQGATNYKEWYRAILGVAQLGGFAAAFEDGKNVASTATGLTKDAADQREMKARGLISRTLSTHIATELDEPPQIIPAGSSTPKKVHTAADRIAWLKSKYEKKDAVSVILEWQKLITARLVDDGTLESQLNYLWELRSRCALNGIKIDDYVFASTILTQLPETFSHISDTLLATKKVRDLTPEEVRSKILETEIPRKGNNAPPINAPRTPNTRNSTRSRGLPPGPCRHCGKEGHWQRDCLMNKRNQQDSPRPKPSSSTLPDYESLRISKS